MKKTLAKLILCLLVIAGMSFLWACSYRPRPARTSEGEILFRLGFSGKPDSLNPYTASSREAEAVFSLLYDTLFAEDPATGNVIPSLCAGYSVRDSAAGGKVWDITLRENVFWHDGELLTASDVEFSLQSLKELSVFYGYPYCELLDVTGIAVGDDTHLSMVVWGEEEQILHCLARIPVLPRHIWNRADYMDYGKAGICADLSRALSEIGSIDIDESIMIGSGLYIWNGYSEGECRLKLNREYWNGTARAEVLELHFGLDSAASALKEGSIDACWDMSLRSWQDLSNEKSVRIAAGADGDLLMLTFNHRESTFAHDVRIRRAIDLCINRQAILLMAFGGGFADRGMLSPFSSWYYSSRLSYDRGYSTAEAANALETAGFKDKNGDGYRESPGGVPLMLTLVYSSSDPSWGTAAELIRSSCSQAGIAVTLQPLTPLALEETVASGRYDILMHASSTDPEPWHILHSFYWDEGRNDMRRFDGRNRFVSLGWNVCGYANQDFDAVYEKLLSAKDEELAKSIVLKAGQILYDDAASIPIGFHVYYQACSSVWYSFIAGKTDGLYFSPHTLAQQIKQMNCA